MRRPALAQRLQTVVQLARNSRRSPPAPAGAPLVSVIVATYNWSSVLRYALRSALWQTYPNIEVIVVGDACTDDSEAVVASFGDARVRWHNLPVNSGSQAGPNQAALGLARGEYVAYLGHDDLWLPTHIAILMEGVRSSGARVAWTRAEWIGPGGRYRWSGGRPPSALLHETRLGREIGWRDFREIVRPPDTDFVDRATERAGGSLELQALTVFKFPSTWRRNSYVEKPCEDQAAYASRIEHERFFVYRELAGIVRSRLRGDEVPARPPEPPETVPPGWWVTEFRRMRGLEPPS